MNSLFGVELPTPVNFVIAFVVVLLLIGAATWLVRRFGVARLDAASRSRQPRLAVVDAAAVDGRRKLVIIRRDNVEHLLMIGGPTDVVVETNIVRAATAVVREPPAARTNGSGEPLPRAAPMAEPTPWPLQPEPAPSHAPPSPARAERAPRIVAEDPSRWDSPVETPARAAARPADALAGLASELSRPLADPNPKPRVVASDSAPLAQSAAAAVSHAAPSAEHSLAEMAQRLEAALRRPSAPARFAAESRPPANAAVREARVAAVPPKSAAQAKPAVAPQPSANLEQEMASLLGRPGKT